MEGQEVRAKVIDEKTKEDTKRSFKDRISDGLDSAKKKVAGAWHWAMDNKADIGATILAAGAIIKLGKEAGLIKSQPRRVEDDRRLRVYDPHTGVTYYLRRALTNSEKFELEERSRKGEGYGYILSDMGVLSGRY